MGVRGGPRVSCGAHRREIPAGGSSSAAKHRTRRSYSLRSSPECKESRSRVRPENAARKLAAALGLDRSSKTTHCPVTLVPRRVVQQFQGRQDLERDKRPPTRQRSKAGGDAKMARPAMVLRKAPAKESRKNDGTSEQAPQIMQHRHIRGPTTLHANHRPSGRQRLGGRKQGGLIEVLQSSGEGLAG